MEFPKDLPWTDDHHVIFSVQELQGSKELGLEKLNRTIQQGEKLYPDTSAAGREQIRQQLRAAKDSWDEYLGELSEMQSQLDSSLTLWSVYRDSTGSLDQWLLNVETSLKADTEPKNTLQEKRAQLQNNKVQYTFRKTPLFSVTGRFANIECPH